MIISASRRTDLPAFHGEWLCRRFSAGYALVRHPFRPHLVWRIPLAPDAAEGIVFWTKNPLPLARRLSLFAPWPYYFQWTLTPYGRDIEPGLPEKGRLLSAFRALSEHIGAERLVWRYDPILISPAWTAERHGETFASFCRELKGSADTCIISFLDPYRHIARALSNRGIRPPDAAEREQILASFRQSAARFGFSLRACCEAETDLPPAACIDGERLSRIAGRPIPFARDRSQRKGCTCAAAADIGAYSTCPAGCCYCYAVRSRVAPASPVSPLLGPPLTSLDTVTDRTPARSPCQPSLFAPPPEDTP